MLVSSQVDAEIAGKGNALAFNQTRKTLLEQVTRADALDAAAAQKAKEMIAAAQTTLADMEKRAAQAKSDIEK